LDPRTRAELVRDIHSSTLVGVDEIQQVNVSIEQAQLALQELEEKKRFVGLRLSGYQEKLDLRAKRLQREEERLTGDTIGSENSGQHANSGHAQEETKPLAGSQPRLRIGRSLGGIGSADDSQDDQSDEYDESYACHNDEETGEASLSIEELKKQQAQLQSDQIALEKVEKSYKDMETNTRELQKRIFVLERKREEIMQKTGECRDFLVAAAHIEHMQETEDDGTIHSHEDLEEGQSVEDSSTGNELVVLLSESTEELRVNVEAEREEDSKAK